MPERRVLWCQRWANSRAAAFMGADSSSWDLYFFVDVDKAEENRRIQEEIEAEETDLEWKLTCYGTYLAVVDEQTWQRCVENGGCLKSYGPLPPEA